MTFPHRTRNVLVVLALGLACAGSEESARQAAGAAPLVEAVEARFGALPLEETVPGAVRARNQVMVRPEVDGRIVEVLVQSGDSVERGQLLVRLDEAELADQLRQAEAEVRLAEAAVAAEEARLAELEGRAARGRALAEQELLSAQDLESLEAQLAALRAGGREASARLEQRRSTVDERRSALAKTRVRAPVSGSLGERRAEVGMRVDPSDVLFVLGDLDELVVEINLTEALLETVETDLPVVLETRGGGDAVRASVSRISPFLAEESFTTIAEIDVDNRERRLRPGMFVTARILVGESRQATLVPIASLWREPESGVRGVFVIEEPDGLETPSGENLASPDRVRSVAFHPVEILAEGRGAAGVAGIEAGAWVVTVGQQLLSEALEAPSGGAGARVRPVAWQRVLALQDLQDEDLLEGFLDKQRKIAAALGTEIPPSEDVVDRVLEEAAATPPAGPQGTP